MAKFPGARVLADGGTLAAPGLSFTVSDSGLYLVDLTTLGIVAGNTELLRLNESLETAQFFGSVIVPNSATVDTSIGNINQSAGLRFVSGDNIARLVGDSETAAEAGLIVGGSAGDIQLRVPPGVLNTAGNRVPGLAVIGNDGDGLLRWDFAAVPILSIVTGYDIRASFLAGEVQLVGLLNLTTGAMQVAEIAVPTTPAAGKIKVYGSTGGEVRAVDSAGTVSVLNKPPQTVQFTASGTFTKASYPGLKAVKVRVLGGGGAGGGAASTGAGQASLGSGGGSGGYAESFILASALSASTTVTVGAGGTGVAGAAGNNGGNTSFGTAVIGQGGDAGGTVAASTPPFTLAGGARSGTGSAAGDVIVSGRAGAPAIAMSASVCMSGAGADSQYGAAGQGRANSNAGQAATGYGAGGAGAVRNASVGTTAAGGAGTAGIVLIDLFF